MLTRTDNFLQQEAQARRDAQRLDRVEDVLVETFGRDSVHRVHDSIMVDVPTDDGKIIFERG